MARSENTSLKHVADVIREGENQQSWSEMQSVRVFAHESQEPIQRASFQTSPSRTERWPSKKARYSHGMTYVRTPAARPAPTVRAVATQAAAALPAAKPPAYSCWGCDEATHRREEYTFLSHVCGGCKKVGHFEAVC